MEKDRSQYFENLQRRLQFSARFGYICLKATVLSELSGCQKYHLPEVRQITRDDFFVIDDISEKLYPEKDDLCKGFFPIRIYGDGNCLCRAASMYLFSSEDHHIEMRCRIIFEMVLHKDSYLGDQSFHQYALFSESYLPSDNLKSITGIEAIFERTILLFCKKDEYGDMWTLTALSSALGCTVLSIFPDLIGTKRDRHMMHKRLEPRQKRSEEVVRIMWTTTHRNSANDLWWLPNHFVACAPAYLQRQPVSTASKRRSLTLGDFFTTSMKATVTDRKKQKRNTDEILSPGLDNPPKGVASEEINDQIRKNGSAEGIVNDATFTDISPPINIEIISEKGSPEHYLNSISKADETNEACSSDLPHISTFQSVSPAQEMEVESNIGTEHLHSNIIFKEDSLPNVVVQSLTPDLSISCDQIRKEGSTEGYVKDSTVTDTSPPINDLGDIEIISEHNFDSISKADETNEAACSSDLPQSTFQTFSPALEMEVESNIGTEYLHSNMFNEDSLPSTSVIDQSLPLDLGISSPYSPKIKNSLNTLEATVITDSTDHAIPEQAQTDIDVNSENINSNTFPYDLSFDFYYKMGRSAALNRSRDDSRNYLPVKKDSDNKLISVKRTENTRETLVARMPSLQKKLMWESKQSKRAHLTAVIECGSYILKNGPIVKTQTLCDILKGAKAAYKCSSVSTKRKLSIELLETLSKYLPVMQIYISGTGYIMEYKDGDIQGFVNDLSTAVNQREIANKNLESTLENFDDYLKFTDTQLDKSIIRSILVEIFSVNSVSRLEGSKCKETLRRARDEIPRKMKKFKDLKQTLLSVRNDMTNHQQNCFYYRRVAKMKARSFKCRAKGAGRPKIADKFPQLAEVLELAFGEGSKIHPRLENDTRYKNPNLALTMPQAREILLTVASDKIPNIALSTCYTYTQNFRKNTIQATRHHLGQDVNAKISLKKLPRVGMMEERVNAHYCRAHVNFQLENATSESNDTLVDAKDAKGIVCADIDPVQNIGKSWLNTTRQDHQFDQSRTNACTPMTHLFLKTITTETVIKSSNVTAMNVVRTGQPVTLVNISFFEPETVFRCFNELFLLLSIPALDDFFRNKETGKLRKKWIFVVDNGPSEAPSSTLVRMLLVRLVNFLDLDSATQISFEKLNSKDNPAERPHASENLVLSKHGPFKSSEIFPDKNAKPGTPKHLENMEAMAKEVISCLESAKFGQNQFFCFRGVKDNFLFDDENDLRNFLKLSEQGKNECEKEYKVVNCSMLAELSQVWEVESDYTGSYVVDYNHLCNSVLDNVKTAWLTEYCSSIFSKKPKNMERFVKEPIPDFVRWLTSDGELHYMCFEARQHMTFDEWDSEELFLPSNTTSLFSDIYTDIPESVVDLAALLAWITPDEFKKDIQKLADKMEHNLENDKQREKWRKHELFKKTVAELQTEAKNTNIPYTAKHSKSDLIKIIAEKKNMDIPKDIDVYNGNLADVPKDVNSLTNLTTYELRQILKYHNMNFSGIKDELVMKVFLLRHNRSYTIVESSINKLSKLAEIAVSIIIWQKRYYNDINHIYRQRHYSAIKSATSSVIKVPEHISDDNLTELFDPLFDWLDTLIKSKFQIDQERKIEEMKDNGNRTANPYEQCKEIGSKIKVYWSREEIGTFKWDIGWYFAHVISYDENFDSIDIEYVKEPGCIYTLDLTSHFLNGKLKFVSSPFYS